MEYMPKIQQVIADARCDVEVYPGAIKTANKLLQIINTSPPTLCDTHRPIWNIWTVSALGSKICNTIFDDIISDDELK